MTTQQAKPQRVWTVAEAQARLPEILRLAAEEGPQRISAGKSFVIAAERRQPVQAPPRKPMGQWLIENMPRGANLENSRWQSVPTGDSVRYRRDRVSGYLRDTDVVSELTKNVPHPQVMAFLAEQHDLWLSAMRSARS